MFALSWVLRLPQGMGRFALILSSGLGVGYIPWASGTFGSLWGILLFYLGRNLPWPFYFFGLGLFIFVAIFLAHRAERVLGSHDSSIIVIDEVVGYLVAVAGLSFQLGTVVLAFVLFRGFDIFKPFPIRAIDQSGKGGWSVVLDDVLAGVYANIGVRLIYYLYERWGT